MSELIDRFLRYVVVDTQSAETSDQSPSSMKQHDLAKLLYRELKDMGVEDVRYDEEHCYVYASIPANNKDDLPKGARPFALGFVSHMDTSPDASGKDVKPKIVSSYDGGDITLNEAEGVVLSPRDFPNLKEQAGNDLIVTDGTTLLGADDKAGVAEIMTLVAYVMAHPKMKHGDLRVGFTPDEEIGEGVRFFDLEGFRADAAYTVDGGGVGDLEYENFNAADAQVIVNGRSVHPGSAKGQMINATLVAYEFQSMLPAFENPMYTEGREGFFHLNQMRGTTDKAAMHYILRDHDLDKLEQKKAMMCHITDFLNLKYGDNTVELLMEDTYYNMIEKIRPHAHLIESAREAMRALNVTPKEAPIRGGTDGAMLSYKGLPCPNLGTGGYNFHGRFEYASVQEMETSAKIVQKIAEIYGAYYIDDRGACKRLPAADAK